MEKILTTNYVCGENMRYEARVGSAKANWQTPTRASSTVDSNCAHFKDVKKVVETVLTKRV